MSLCVMLIIIIHIIALMGMMSCSTHRHATAVEQGTHTDTVYIATQQYDSIYIYNDKTLDRTKDTVYLRELSTEYRYKLLRDTLRVTKSDTVYIQHEDEVAISADAERPLSWFDRLARVVCWIVIGGAVVWLWMRTKSHQS